ncbi:hypothetical protein SAMN05518854_11752 [Variovorax sp. YR266]|uniref:hypothetical protein n=1 Tax=Variovorax sp. YR266 TaxID=1884386 RepID=UPI00089BDE64|nr:hypothetical protein [Variovorax sp. YR266]SDZ71262.1 hypothetical protein SAMN05518854_11752 [Variovorax sp. YR266]
MDELFVLLDITGCENWPFALQYLTGPASPRSIPPEGRSNVLQVSRSAAEREAVRLAEMHPGRTFGLFLATHATVRAEIPTYVNFKGDPLQTRTLCQLAPIDDGIPF